MFPGFLSEINMKWKFTKFVDIDQNLLQLLSKFVRYVNGDDLVIRYDEMKDILLKYTYLHREYCNVLDAYFDAQAEIHTLLLENKFLIEKINDNDNSEDNS